MKKPLGESHAYDFIYNVGGDPIGIFEWHRNTNGREDCLNAYLWEPGLREPGVRYYELISLDPLTLSPRIVCATPGCEVEGFITEGRWDNQRPRVVEG